MPLNIYITLANLTIILKNTIYCVIFWSCLGKEEKRQPPLSRII